MTLLLYVFQKFAKSGVVFISNELWLGDNGGAVLEIDKTVRTLKMEIDFLRVKEVKHRDVVLAKAEVLEGVT